MQNSKFFVLIFFVSFFLSQCGEVREKGTLTDEKVMQYLAAYKNLREKAPAILENYNKSGDSLQAGQAGFSDFESAIKESGLSSYSEFVMLNAKIGTIFGIIQGTKGMEQFEGMHEAGQTMFDDGRKTIQKQLDDPSVPEETKTELRKTLEELNKGEQQVNQEYDKNMKWGNFVMDKAKKLSGLIVNEKDIEIVKNREAEIFEAYTGFPPPAGLDENFKSVDMDFD